MRDDRHGRPGRVIGTSSASLRSPRCVQPLTSAVGWVESAQEKARPLLQSVEPVPLVLVVRLDHFLHDDGQVFETRPSNDLFADGLISHQALPSGTRNAGTHAAGLEAAAIRPAREFVA